MAAKAYGIDFAGGRLIVARAERGKAGVVAAGAPGDSAVREALETARREAGAGRAALAVAAPACATLVRELRTPLKSRAKASRVWESLLDLALPAPVEETVWAVADERAGEGGAGRSATAYAVARRDLAPAEEEWRERGVEPTHEDAFPAALWSAAGRAARPEAWRVAVWLGDEWAVAVGGTGGVARTWHVLRASPGAGEAFVEQFARRARHFLDLDHAPDVLWGGPGAADDALRGRLEAAVRECGGTVRFGSLGGGEGAVAVALARRAAAGETVGFMAGERANPSWATRERREAGRWRGLAAAAAAVAVLACAAVLSGRAAEVRGLRDEVSAAAERLAGRRVARGAERMMLGREPLAGMIAARNEAFLRLGGAGGGGRAVADGVEELLEAAAEAGVPLERCGATEGAVSARAGGEEAAERLAGALEARGWTVDRAGAEVRGRKAP